MKKILLLIALFSFNIFAFDEGIDYTVLDKPVKTQNINKIEVKEMFWYYCPHCFSLEPYLKKWLKTIDSTKIDFIQQPAVPSSRWENGAIFFFVLEKLNILDELHTPLFEAIHIHKLKLNSKKSFINWVLKASNNKNITKEKIEKIFKSFSIKNKLNQARKYSKDYQLSGVPAVIVNGKYLTSVSQAGGYKQLFKLIDFLIKKEQNNQ
ncbi:Periplasmic thiol:disulfide interchange protein DsbA [hydrothermal vent metagenome]|uniref:Thiol:disulfide interchange protein DsbA n=1 Tax=hydrothermal vent metagenome TaxID=652676 RepID=A0A1W1CMK5_9ZZZZ